MGKFKKIITIILLILFIISNNVPILSAKTKEVSNVNAVGRTPYVFPVKEPVYYFGKILQTGWYSYLRKDMKGEKYKALNFPAREGSMVIACQSGTVTITKYAGYAGNIVRVEQEDGVTLEYCHLSSYVVHPSYINSDGQKVEASKVRKGDLIGYIGHTGRTSGPHLRLVAYDKNGEKMFINAWTFGMDTEKFYYRGDAEVNYKFDIY